MRKKRLSKTERADIIAGRWNAGLSKKIWSESPIAGDAYDQRFGRWEAMRAREPNPAAANGALAVFLCLVLLVLLAMAARGATP